MSDKPRPNIDSREGFSYEEYDAYMHRSLACQCDYEYRGYTIRPISTPIAAAKFEFVSREYDGPEDRRCGFAASVDDAKMLIDELEE